ncbi:MAG: hypothetical protein RLN60_01920 [Phycisphaerales bacterium]
MLGRKQLILIASAGITVAVAAVALSTSRDDDGHLLVNQLFEIAGPPDVPEKTKKKARPEPAPVPKLPAIEGLPSDRVDEAEVDLDALMRRPLPSGLAEPFYGTWGERSFTDDATTTITTTLHRGGTFELTAVQKSRSDPSAAVRLATRGRWTMQGDEVVLAVETTDSEEIIPVGFVQVYASSSVRGDEWTYEDSDGQRRVARRK